MSFALKDERPLSAQEDSGDESEEAEVYGKQQTNQQSFDYFRSTSNSEKLFTKYTEAPEGFNMMSGKDKKVEISELHGKKVLHDLQVAQLRKIQMFSYMKQPFSQVISGLKDSLGEGDSVLTVQLESVLDSSKQTEHADQDYKFIKHAHSQYATSTNLFSREADSIKGASRAHKDNYFEEKEVENEIKDQMKDFRMNLQQQYEKNKQR